ncbi:phosphoglycerate dehydrogenase [Thermodesulfobacteriota bacterium]
MSKIRVGITPSSFASSNPAPKIALESAGIEVIDNPYKRRLTEQEAFDYLSDKDGLVAGLEPLTQKVLENAKSLKAIARVGIGIENVDLDAAHNLGIKVSNTPDGPTNAVAEMTLTTALVLSRKLLKTNRKMHEGFWVKEIGKGLTGQKMLFVGYGRIGRATAQLMRTFGTEILVYDPFLNEQDLVDGEKAVSLEEGLPQADIISLHANSREIILGPEQFSMAKDGVILLNSARGELVDENAFIAALESGKVAAGWFDAFWQEPYKGRLLEFENVILTPHMGTYTEQCRLAMEMDAVNNLLRDLGLGG